MKTTMGYHYMCTMLAKMKRADEDVERLELPRTVGGRVNQYVHFRNRRQ